MLLCYTDTLYLDLLDGLTRSIRDGHINFDRLSMIVCLQNG